MAALPQGAKELILALMTPTPKGYWGVPALVWGRPGTGKSTFIESLAQTDFPVFTIIASLHDPTDFSGLPVHDNGRMRFLPPDWTEAFEEHKKGILFLDELTTAPPTVQAALLRLVLERKVGTHPLPACVRIAAAANPPDIAASGWELSPPLANRFVHIEWNLDGETYRTALEEGFSQGEFLNVDPDKHNARVGYWKSLVAGFLRRNPALAHTDPTEEEYAFASPRTWDFAIALMATCDLYELAPKPGAQSTVSAQPFVNLLKGCIGSGATTSFLEYVRKLRIPDPEEVLQGNANVDTGLREDELQVLFNAMAQKLRGCHKANDENLSAYSLRFLEQSLRIAESNKADSMYTAIRSLVKTGTLQAAAQTPQIRTLIQQLGRFYGELTAILEGRG